MARKKVRKTTAEEILSLGESDSPLSDVGPAEHVVKRGEKIRKATEEEEVAAVMSKPKEQDKPITEQDMQEYLKNVVDAVRRFRANRKAWEQKFSHQERLILMGAYYCAAEALGHKDEAGLAVSLSRYLGFDYEIQSKSSKPQGR